jgi:4-carboxymuconolactone decarboxylase
MKSALYKKGIATRTKVMGKKHIARRHASPDKFSMQQQQFVTEYAWGAFWSRKDLPLKIRSLVTLAMITALGKEDELKGHIRGALNNGATPEEIMGVFHHATVYCGFPAANGAVRVGAAVFKELGLIE